MVIPRFGTDLPVYYSTVMLQNPAEFDLTCHKQDAILIVSQIRTQQ
jgi:hypothetical protein